MNSRPSESLSDITRPSIVPAHLPVIPAVQVSDSQHVSQSVLRAAEGTTQSATMSGKVAPSKPTIKSLPTVRDHTTDQLTPSGDEFVAREVDEYGEKKIGSNGELSGDRRYRCRTFLVPNRGEKLFMLATECARVLGYRDSYLLFNKNRSLHKIIASPEEKEDLVAQQIIPFSYRSRQIAIVTARSMFRQFGSRVIESGHRVRDDYWETKARKQGFTDADLASDKRPGAAKSREAATAALIAASTPQQQQTNIVQSGPSPEVVYAPPGPFPGPPQQPTIDLDDARTRDFGAILNAPRQKITGPPYIDATRPAAMNEIHAHSQQAAEYNSTINHQRDIRSEYVASMWRRPHEATAVSSLVQPDSNSAASGSTGLVLAAASAAPTALGRTAPSPRISPSSVMPLHSPQLMMPVNPAYSQSIHSQHALNQGVMRGMTQHQNPTASATHYGNPTVGRALGVGMGSGPGPASGSGSFSYPPPGQIWQQPSQSSVAAQNPYSSYGAASSSHGGSAAPQQLRHPQAGSIAPQFSTVPAMQAYGPPGAIYGEQASRQYMAPGSSVPPNSAQGWSNQQPPAQQWWPNHQG